MLNKSAFVTEDLLEKIFARFKDEWTRKYITEIKGRVAAVIIVLDPAHPVEESHAPVELWHGILGEQNPENWPKDRPYHEFAFAKARAAWRTKMSNHEMFMNLELIQQGDFKYEGGIYISGGLVIATSGLTRATDDTIVSSEFAREIHTEISQLWQQALADKDNFFF